MRETRGRIQPRPFALTCTLEANMTVPQTTVESLKNQFGSMFRQSQTVFRQHDAATFEQVKNLGGLREAGAYVMLAAVAAALVGSLFTLAFHVSFLMSVLTPLLSVPLGFFAFTGAVYLIGTRVFKSSATFDQVAYAFALFFVPLSVVSSLLGLIPFLGILAALPVVVVEVYLGIHATRGSLNLTERREVYLTLLGGVLGNILVGGMVTAIVGAMVFASLMRGY